MPGRNGCRVFIGRIPYSCREKDLERFFRNYGHLRDIIIKHGYGFVEFDDERDADDAVYELNGKDLLGERVTVEHAKGVPRRVTQREFNRRPAYQYQERKRYGPPVRTPYRVIVENLSTKVSWQDLKDFMRKAGEITYADAHRQHRNEGLVEFQSYSDLKRCLDKLDGKELMGRRIRLVSQYRSRTRSRSRSGSRYRSRSRSRSRGSGRGRGSRSRSRSDDRGKSRSRSRSHSRSRSKSQTPDKKKSDDSKKEPMDTDEQEGRSRSGSRNREEDRSRSRSRSGSADSRRDQQSPRRSKSGSPGVVNGETNRKSHSRSPNGNKSVSRSPDRSGGETDSRGSASPASRDED